MQRVVVIGSSGAGKTTLARALSRALELPFTEQDELFHLPGWTERPLPEFRRIIAETFPAGGRWITDGNYGSVHDILHPRADTFVWLDYERPLIMRRLIARTLRRTVTREELWNGNREPWSNFMRWDPEHNIIRWSWTHFEKYRALYEDHAAGPQWAHATVHRLQHPDEADAFLAGCHPS
ncbi:MAG: hypothetical protein HKN26_09550 [Acidimicrobiales bacterium]|nr:hypothetical protein [Acidimicrobiales bacterium]